MGNQMLGSDKIIRLNDQPLLGNVQSFEWSPAFNAEDIFELGRTDKVASALELETSGSFEVLSGGGTAGILARMIVKRNAGTGAFEGYEWTVGNKNNYTFTQASLKECNFDVLSHEKSDQLSWDRTVALPRCFLTTISGRADANGSASETYNFQGDFVAGFPSPYHAMRSIPAVFATSSTVQLADNAVANTGYGLAYLYIDERRVRTTGTDPVFASLGAAGIITVTGLTLDAKMRFQALVFDNTTPTTTFPALLDADRTTTSFFTKGYMADIFIAPAVAATPTQNEKWLKVQSLDWNVDMRVEPLRQIAFNAAGSSVYCRLPTYPFTISANATVYETDWSDWKAIMDTTEKPFGNTGTDVYGESYDFAPKSLKNAFAVVLIYYDKIGTELQRWTFSDMRIEGYGQRTNVGGRAEITWGLRGTAFTLDGTNG